MLFPSRGQGREMNVAWQQAEWSTAVATCSSFFMLCIRLLNNQFFHIIFTCVRKSAESLAKHQQFPALTLREELMGDERCRVKKKTNSQRRVHLFSYFCSLHQDVI
ncbi:hypothetical protein XENOCAPTIV_003547 [Xenoophorus captivus]|uniref:Uncharacterized protein n=1 Tax=Xenoophorus captivus TaxID=1517983 RepID=A0ABV0RPB0_9TELE